MPTALPSASTTGSRLMCRSTVRVSASITAAESRTVLSVAAPNLPIGFTTPAAAEERQQTGSFRRVDAGDDVGVADDSLRPPLTVDDQDSFRVGLEQLGHDVGERCRFRYRRHITVHDLTDGAVLLR